MNSQGPTIGDYLAQARQRLLDAGVVEAAFDARLLVSGLMNFSATEMLTREGHVLSPSDQQRLDAAIERRAAREPVHRILGEREFFGLRFTLSAMTLEPRPDTEVLVEAVIRHLQRVANENGPLHILDMGTGTGAVCLALLHVLDEARGLGSDIAPQALETAKANAALNGLHDRFDVVEADWFDGIEGCFHAIVSNPPYIASRVIDDLEPEVRRHDPIVALDGGTDGLDAYRAIAADAASFVHPKGLIGLEIGYDQKEAVSRIFTENGFQLIEAVKDFSGHDRALVFTCCESSGS